MHLEVLSFLKEGESMKKIAVLVICAVLLNSCQWVDEAKMKAVLWLYKMQNNAGDFSQEIQEGLAKGQVVATSDLTIKAEETTLMFEPQEILALPGQEIKIKVINQLQRPLNFLLLQQGDDPVVVSQLALQVSNEDQNWMPPEDYYLAATGPILPRKNEKISVRMPEQEGVYYFVSTFPSSPAVLRGKFIIVKKNTAEKNTKESALAQESSVDEKTL